MIKLTHILILLTFLATSCNKTKNKENIPVISFEDCSETVDLKLTDIAKDFRFVKLQTDSTCYIDGGAFFEVSDKYIISYDGNRILQFSSDGQFIKCLAKQGRGPHEFLQVNFCHINSTETVLYFKGYGEKVIKSINLKTGKFGREIKFAEPGISSLLFVNDSTLAVMPGGYEKDRKHSIFYQNLDSKLIASIPLNKKEKNNKALLFNKIFKQGEKIYSYDPWLNGDTIYHINGLKKKPYLLLKGVNNYSLDKVSKGIASQIMYFSSCFCIFQNIPIANSIENGCPVPSCDDPTDINFRIARLPEFKPQILSSFTNDFTNIKYDKYGIIGLIEKMQINNNKLIFKMEALDILEALKKKSRLKIPQQYYKQYLDITKGLTENDNPVLLIANVK